MLPALPHVQIPRMSCPIDAVEMLNDYLIEQVGQPAPGKIGHRRGLALARLIKAGIAHFERNSSVSQLIETTHRLRSTILSMQEINADEPCPPRADPKWWQYQQRQRRERAQEEFQRALREADELSRQLEELARKIREGASQ